jgi:hypothetical protein
MLFPNCPRRPIAANGLDRRSPIDDDEDDSRFRKQKKALGADWIFSSRPLRLRLSQKRSFCFPGHAGQWRLVKTLPHFGSIAPPSAILLNPMLPD